MIGDLNDILAAARRLCRPPVVAVASAADPEVLSGIADAVRLGVCKPILIGEAESIRRLADDGSLSLSGIEVLHADDGAAACERAVRCCREGRADMLMKGMVATATILKAVLNRETGLHAGRLLSHAALFRSPRFDRLMILTDAGVNIAPDVARKRDIILNSADMARQLGLVRPRVALLAAIETIKSDMPATTDAAILAQMGAAGQLGDCEVDGPFALDLAVSEASAASKRVARPVAGHADILVAPDIEAGNVLYKSLVYFAGLEMANLVLGARVPMIVTSRADSATTRLYSIALAALLTQANLPLATGAEP